MGLNAQNKYNCVSCAGLKNAEEIKKTQKNLGNWKCKLKCW